MNAAAATPPPGRPPQRVLLLLLSKKKKRVAKMQESGQLFTRETQAIFFNAKTSPIQRMLDFDFLCGA